MLHVTNIAEKLGIPNRYLVSYGDHIAKVKLELLSEAKAPRQGKFILVTAITPTSHGEGKTVVSIGLAQALARLGQQSVVTSREPSLGPVFGLKGGATGGGKSQVLPAEKINLHFTGDFHAITAAHNLLAAAIDSHFHHGNDLQLDVDNIFWPRTMDINDRALRHIVVGLGGKGNSVPRETGFIITAASEIMAIMGLSTSRDDLRCRLGRIVIGFDLNGQLVHAEDLRLTGALMVLLHDAIMPNLVQTSEGTPAFVHTGPFANIAHGTSSLLSQMMAMRYADYVINESGFGADLGAEKYFDIVMPQSGLKPSAAVLIATARALAAHGATPESPQASGPAAVERGLPNLDRHLENLHKFGVSVVVAINRFPTDTEDELEVIRRFCRQRRVAFADCEAYSRGGEGAQALAEQVIEVASRSHPEEVSSLYLPKLDLEEKIFRIAGEIYGAAGVNLEPEARKKLKKFTALGFGHLPICVAKTQSSLSDDPKRLGAPTGWTMTVSDAHLSAGAGFVVAVAGKMMLMPGLPKSPQAEKLDVNAEGKIVGMNY